MLIYFIIFIVSTFFCNIAEKCFKNENKKIGKFFSVVAILIPSIFAGIRAKGVGTDTLNYISYVFHYVNIYDIGHVCEITNVEPLYVMLNSFVSNFFGNINVLYFILEFITLIFIYQFCYDNRNDSKYTFSYFCFLILFFNKTLNMARQSISIAIFLYATKYLFDKKILKYCLFILLASGFHITALIGIPVYIGMLLLESRYKKIFIIITSGVLAFGLLFYKKIISFLVLSLGILDYKYLNYIASSNIYILKIEYIFILLMVLLFFLFIKKLSFNSKYKKYIIMFIIGFAFYNLGFFANYVYRLSYYFTYLIIILIPHLQTIFKGKDKFIFKLIMILLLFLYSYLYYDFYEYDQTIPYQSILGVD